MPITVLKMIAIALIAAALVYPSDLIPLGTRIILLGALAIGSVLWLSEGEDEEEEQEAKEENEAEEAEKEGEETRQADDTEPRDQ